MELLRPAHARAAAQFPDGAKSQLRRDHRSAAHSVSWRTGLRRSGCVESVDAGRAVEPVVARDLRRGCAAGGSIVFFVLARNRSDRAGVLGNRRGADSVFGFMIG